LSFVQLFRHRFTGFRTCSGTTPTNPPVNYALYLALTHPTLVRAVFHFLRGGTLEVTLLSAVVQWSLGRCTVLSSLGQVPNSESQATEFNLTLETPKIRSNRTSIRISQAETKKNKTANAHTHMHAAHHSTATTGSIITLSSPPSPPLLIAHPKLLFNLTKNLPTSLLIEAKVESPFPFSKNTRLELIQNPSLTRIALSFVSEKDCVQPLRLCSCGRRKRYRAYTLTTYPIWQSTSEQESM
jgi:hypothetical protein